MSQRTTYSDGEPCWPGLSTPDLAEARRFYAALLGWTFDEPDPGLANYVNARSRGEAEAKRILADAKSAADAAFRELDELRKAQKKQLDAQAMNEKRVEIVSGSRGLAATKVSAPIRLSAYGSARTSRKRSATPRSS